MHSDDAHTVVFPVSAGWSRVLEAMGRVYGSWCTGFQIHNVAQRCIDDLQRSAARPCLRRARRPSPRHPTRPDLETEYADAHPVSMVQSMPETCRSMQNFISGKASKPFATYDLISIFFGLYPLPPPVPSSQAQNLYTGLILSYLRLRTMARYAHRERAVSLSSYDFFPLG
ncbi:hypothetical protein OE88DRAFT_810099 [Heliocybe sulcata]|uniref:Uncharacterized protein n=1 Tax=Heliocybe sulcata TaxID=5364 RepID=A0A5C3MUL8_9AGAM|nr:hypothetical protein OE88DRAFT_810099 [Heliocybe sulcata]